MTELIEGLKRGSPIKLRPMVLMLLCLATLMVLCGMVELWVMSEEYGHGLMVIGLLGYILYRRRDYFSVGRVAHAWLALPLALFALVAVIAGQASGISVVSMYGVLIFAVATILVLGGVSLLNRMLVPLLIIWLLIPLPNPFGPMLTSGLQLISSKLGVWFIRSLGGVVFLEGNVIDMGGVQLLVAEACSGLRYLFPLMSLGAIVGYMLIAPFWVRWTIFLVTIPITVVLNSLRIGLTGMLVETWGMAHTEGFLHFFEGWVVFVFATLILLGVLWLMLRIALPGKTIRDVLVFDGSGRFRSQDGLKLNGMLAAQGGNGVAWWVGGVMLLTVLFVAMLALKTEAQPERKSFGNFPVTLGGWSSHESRLPVETENVAGASEYYYGDFSSRSEGAVNLYISFYKTQLKGQIPHSPKVCIPGGGWIIESLDKVHLKDRYGNSFEANRLVIAKGDRKQLTYYWQKQGKKMYSHELLARVDLVRSSIFENRTDGSLVRLVTDIDKKSGTQVADDRLARFAGLLLGILPDYVPD